MLKHYYGFKECDHEPNKYNINTDNSYCSNEYRIILKLVLVQVMYLAVYIIIYR